ncbi:cupin domain-containing protein [Lentzea sp. NPDC051213]|uniref:cupin domain-containing protein n=1 Tax=Lentzea sp. NPDC051213 TaxID=3364126 RepID=UPI0037B01CAB
MSTPHFHEADIEVLHSVLDAPQITAGSTAVTVKITLPPGSPGGPAHRHSGPAYGYVIKGAIVFEVEGEPERVIHEGEAFSEPGGDKIHYQTANHLGDTESVLTATTFVAPGQPLLTVVSAEELEARKHLRAPRP